MSVGLSMDYKENIGIQLTGAMGATASSSPSIAVSVFRTITNAPDIFELNEQGGCVGGTVFIPGYKVPVYIGGDLAIVGKLDNKPNENYYGATTSIGTGIACEYGGEVHVEGSYTHTIIDFNIIDILFDALNASGCIE